LHPGESYGKTNLLKRTTKQGKQTMLKVFILIVQINNTTPDAFAAYEYQGDCEEIAFILDEAMPNGSAWCEGETK